MLALLAASAAGASAPGAKLDPRLVSSLVTGAPPAAVWVEFADKGEQGPSDLAARLARAERDLTDKARARRERAGLHPLVDYLDLPVEQGYVDALRAQGLDPHGVSRWFNGVAVFASGQALARLAALPFVSRVSPEELAPPRPPRLPESEAMIFLPDPAQTASAGRTEVSYGQTATQLARLGVPAVHDSGYIGTGILICMLDEGFNYYKKHSATRSLPIGPNVRDFVDGDLTVQDTVDTPQYFEHGEWTLSVIGGKLPGIYIGPAFGANYMLGRTEDSGSEKPIEMVNWARGAEWADSVGADIISSSLGYSDFPDSCGGCYSLTYPMMDGHTSIVTRGAEFAAAKGILVVNSAGNSGGLGYPVDKISAPSDANGDSVLCIAAVDSFGVRTSFSSLGPSYDRRIKPDLAAQGRRVLMADTNGDPNSYIRQNGTSFSCPLVAGLAACIMQARPTWPAPLIIRALRATATQASHPDTLLGYGIPNGLAALRWTPDTVGVPGGGGLTFSMLGPNPLRSDGPDLAVRFGLAGNVAAARGSVRAYDASGRRVHTLWVGTLTPGQSLTARWDGTDDRGRALSSGLYFLAFEAGSRRSVLRVASIR